MTHQLRSAFLVFAVATLSLFINGCVSAIEMSRSTPAPLNVKVSDGRPSGLHSGANFAYWIWRDGDGMWHLRTTTANKSRRFQGRIHAVAPGTISGLSEVSVEGSRRRIEGLRMVDGDIAFDFTTKGKMDGLDFRFIGESCLEFDLRIDGDGDPGKIFIGSRQTKPSSSHFTLCP